MKILPYIPITIFLDIVAFSCYYMANDLPTPRENLNSKFLVEDYWGDSPTLLYDEDPYDGWRVILVTNVDDVYWNDSVIYTYCRDDQLIIKRANRYFVIEFQPSNPADFVTRDSLTESQALTILEAKGLTPESMNKVNISSSEFEQLRTRKTLLIFCYFTVFSFSVLLFIYVLSKIRNK